MIDARSRRAFLSQAAAATAGLWLAGRPGWAQPANDRLATQRAAAANAKITVIPLRDRMSALVGSGGNIVVLTGLPSKPDTDGMLLVDSSYSTSQPAIQKALATLGSDPPKVLINTHWHPDHTDGNVWVHSAGATIFSSAKTRERLSTSQRVELYNMNVPALPAGGVPTETFEGQKTLTGNQATIALKSYAPAHTDTDISVYFQEADVLHTGDTWFNGMYPFIDYGTGGNIDGMIRAAEQNLQTATGKTVIVPGHGPIGTRAQLEDFHTMLTTSRDTIAQMKKQGRPLAEVQAAKPTAAFDAKYGAGNTKPDTWAALVYQGV